MKREYVDALIAAVRNAGGDTPNSLRAAIVEGDATGSPIDAYVELVRSRSYAITREHFAELQQQGLTEDAIFEITIAAAAGEAQRAYLRAMLVLDETAD